MNFREAMLLSHSTCEFTLYSGQVIPARVEGVDKGRKISEGVFKDVLLIEGNDFIVIDEISSWKQIGAREHTDEIKKTYSDMGYPIF